MTTEVRPRRSVLYLPASNERAIRKAATLECDTLILDLEDAVSPDAKDQARRNAVAAVRARSFGRREVVVRVNALETPWGEDDLALVSEAGPDAILVPKINEVADLSRYTQALVQAPSQTALWAMVETTRSLFRLDEIAAAGVSSRLSVLVVGTNDLAKEMRAELDPGRAPFLGTLGLIVAAARAYGLGVIDGVFNDLDDNEGFAAQCEQGRAFGFDGKTLIHPSQIALSNAAFSPSGSVVDLARRIIAAFDEPENRGSGAIRLDGKMVERLHLTQAKDTLAVHEAIVAAREIPETEGVVDSMLISSNRHRTAD